MHGWRGLPTPKSEQVLFLNFLSKNDKSNLKTLHQHSIPLSSLCAVPNCFSFREERQLFIFVFYFCHCKRRCKLFTFKSMSNGSTLHQVYEQSHHYVIVTFITLPGKEGIELSTPCFGNTCSTPLSYKPLRSLN